MTRDYKREFVDEVNAAAGYDVAARLKASRYTTDPALKRRLADAIGERDGRDFATFSDAAAWLFSEQGGFPALPHPPAAATASAGRRGRRRDRLGPGRGTVGPLTALPGGSTDAGHVPGRAYSLAELDESRDAALYCSLCCGVIEPGSPMTHNADARGGFCFYHPGCADAPEALA